MEQKGIVNCVAQIWNSGKAWLKVFVSDNNSSSHAALKHTIEARILLEIGRTTVWSRWEEIEGQINF